MSNKKDISIIFCINSDYEWSRAAIKSFKYVNELYKDNVVIFNDNFKHIKYLKKHCSKVITWKNFDRKEDMLERVLEMYQDCAIQLDNKYLCFIDNDTFSHGENFLSQILTEMETHDAKIFSVVTENMIQREEYPEAYKDLIMKDNLIKRFQYYCFVIDNHYFKEKYNINGIYGNKDYLRNDMFDIGTEFHYFCLKNNEKMILKNDSQIMDNYLIHIKPSPTNKSSITNFFINGKMINKEKAKEIIKNTEGFKKALLVADKIGFNLKHKYEQL